ncbi:MAG: hypothetical protein ABIP44_05740 [Pseudoxanthomonas sp.]
MSKPLTKKSFKNALGIGTDAEVASFFQISAAAVSQWGEEDPIPEKRQLQATLRRPDLFGNVAEPMARAG